MHRHNLNRCDPLVGRIALYQGHSLLLTDIHGNMTGATDGFYFRRTRFISAMELRISGSDLQPISATQAGPNTLIAYSEAPLPIEESQPEAGGEIAQKAIILQVNSFVSDGLHQEVRVTNHARRGVSFEFAWRIMADYADQDEAARGRREQTAAVEQSWSGRQDGGELSFRYKHPDLSHGTDVRFSGENIFGFSSGLVQLKLELAPAESRVVRIDVVPIFCETRIEPAYGANGAVLKPAILKPREAWAETCCRLQTSNRIVQAAWDRAVADLYSLQLLEGDDEERFTLSAGVPKYLGLFGRGALMAAWQSALLNPATLRGTLRVLRSWIARDYDEARDAQPGKVLHQRVLGPLALLGKNPFLRYYGDYSAPGLFLLGLSSYLAQTGDLAFFRSMKNDALSVLEWMDRHGDSDGDGLYEYETRAGPGGLKNQGWKDSE
jgi:glycogen debranching enzyme